MIARNSAFTFKGKSVHVAEIGKSLGVRYVLEGSVRKSGQRVRITAQLIDAMTGGHLWAERFDRDLTDIFAVQDDVTTQIVSALSLNLSADDRTSLATEPVDNLEAYDCFLRGRELFARQTKEGNRDAQPLLRRTIELAPGFASGLAWLAGALVIDYVNGWSAAPDETLEESIRTARRAVELDERNPLALWALGFASLWARRFDEAINATERAIAYNPNFALGHITLGTTLHYVGRSEESLKCFERALAGTPIARTFGCISRLRQTTNWAATPRAQIFSSAGSCVSPRPMLPVSCWPRPMVRWAVSRRPARRGVARLPSIRPTHSSSAAKSCHTRTPPTSTGSLRGCARRG